MTNTTNSKCKTTILLIRIHAVPAFKMPLKTVFTSFSHLLKGKIKLFDTKGALKYKEEALCSMCGVFLPYSLCCRTKKTVFKRRFFLAMYSAH